MIDSTGPSYSQNVKRLNDDEWARLRLTEVLASCKLNFALVRIGLWPTLLADMDNAETFRYHRFVSNLSAAQKAAKA